jgi:putative addiction module CopG family antidote
MQADATLNVSLTPELQYFVQDRVATGRYRTASEVVREGLRLLKEKERAQDASAKTTATKTESLGPLAVSSLANDTLTAGRFRELADEWRATRPRGVDLTETLMHPAYQMIIGMGLPAVPHLLAELANKPDHWFWALHVITKENPVPPESEGNLKQMADAWLRWGRERGYIGELD